MGILANGGKHGSQRLLSTETIDFLNTPIVTDFDRVILRTITYGPGMAVNEVKEGRGQVSCTRRNLGRCGTVVSLILRRTTSVAQFLAEQTSRALSFHVFPRDYFSASL